jgi:hypothetical protein
LHRFIRWQVWMNILWEMWTQWQWARNASLWWLWQRVPHVLSLPCPCDTASWRLILSSLFSCCSFLWYALALSPIICPLQETWSFSSWIWFNIILTNPWSSKQVWLHSS